MHSDWRLSFLFLCIVSCSVQLQLHGQWRDPILTSLGPEQGLSTWVNDIAQDSLGYMYFASNAGLYRYDGHTIDYYGHNPLDTLSIGAGDVNSIHVANDGYLWLALRFSGLDRFDPKTQTFRHYALPDVPYRAVQGIQTFYEAPDGKLWLGGNNFRLFAFDPASGTFETHAPDWIDPLADGGRLTILSIVPDRDHREKFWLSVLDYARTDTRWQSYGTVLFDSSDGTFSAFPCVGQVRYQDAEGRLWGNVWSNEIVRYDPTSSLCEEFDYTYIFEGQLLTTVSRDIQLYQDQLLVTTSKAILSFTPEDTFSTFVSGQRQFDLDNLFVDRDSNLWIGTTQGALILDPGRQCIRYFSLDAFEIYPRAYPGRLAYDRISDRIYLCNAASTPSNGIVVIPLDEHQKDDAVFLPTPFKPGGIAIDPQDRIWVTGNGSMYQLGRQTGRLTEVKFRNQPALKLPFVLNLRCNDSGWIATIGESDFYWFHSDSLLWHHVTMRELPGSDFAKSFDNAFDGFTLTNHQTAYLFSNELFSVDLPTGKVMAIRFDRKYNPNTQRIQYAGEDPEGNLWVSTFETVIRGRLEGDTLLVSNAYTVQDGMISPNAVELHPDASGRIWAFTNSGMNAIDPETGSIRYFSTNEGLPDPYIDPRQVIDAGEGRIATVCANGLVVFNADALWSSVSPSNVSVVLKHIRIGGEAYDSIESVDFLKTLHLRPDQTLVDIEFQGLAFPNDHQVEYSYRLLGLNDQWVPIGQNRFVTLPALTAGDYIFEVKAGSPFSDAEVTSLKIHMDTPLYLRPWFLLLTLTVLATLIIGMTQWRIRRVRKEEAARTEVNKKIAELELKALRSQMNPHFMFNSLNSIKNYILQAQPRLAAEYLSNFAHLIRMILQNSREKSISLQEELDTLVLYIELEKLRFEDAFEFSCVIDEALNLEQIQIPPMLLQPYVENAIWHGLMHKKEAGHLLLQFARENGHVLCTIEDDGVGRAAAHAMKSLSAMRYKSMGMGITRDRIEIMNNMDALGIQVDVLDKFSQDGNASGTRVTIRIPEMHHLL